MLRKFRYIFSLTLILALGYGMYYAYQVFPIISGFGAKTMCSCVFNDHRSEASVLSQELNAFLLSLSTVNVDQVKKEVTAKVFGFASRKAVYQEGYGCTLLAADGEINEKPPLEKTEYRTVDSLSYPYSDKLADSIPSHISIAELAAFVHSYFIEKDTSRLMNTRAVVVIYDNQLILEEYAPGFSKESVLVGWSMTKSIVNAMVGVLVKQGKLSITDTALFDSWNRDERKSISLNNLLRMNSGLEWEEVYSGPSAATKMLYTNPYDMGAIAMNFKLKELRGTKWEYSSGTSNIISKLIRNKIGEDKYYGFPYKEVFFKLGMKSVIFETDASGTYVGSSYCFMNARDWGRFGSLYYNDGIWMGDTILPSGWVDYSSTLTNGSEGKYGAHFWVNKPSEINGKKTLPDVPEDTYMAQGYQQQKVFVIPSKKLVIVRLGLTKDKQFFDFNGFVKGIIDNTSAEKGI